jgi:hypothetical protein
MISQVQADFDPKRGVVTVTRRSVLGRPGRLEVTEDAVRYLRHNGRQVVVFSPQDGEYGKKLVWVQKRSHNPRTWDQVTKEWLAVVGRSRPRIPMSGFRQMDVQWACEYRGWDFTVVDAHEAL